MNSSESIITVWDGAAKDDNPLAQLPFNLGANQLPMQ